MSQHRKAVVAAISIAIAFLICSASLSLAAQASPTKSGASAGSQSPSAPLEAMAQRKFGTALSAAERKLLRAAPMRALAWLGPDDDPDSRANDTSQGEHWGPERTVRAEVLSWLASDAEASRFVHPSGLGLAGARIDGKLDLSYATVDKPITLVKCYIPDGIDLSSGRIEDFEVRRSRTGSIDADMSITHRDLSFQMGDYGAMSFMRAKVEGSLDMSGARILDGGTNTVNLVEASIGGDVIFHEHFMTNGSVDARLAKIAHDLSFHDAAFAGEGGLNAERATVGGTFYWVEIKHTAKTTLDLENTRAGAIWDDEESWPAPGNLIVSGFVYGEIAGGPGDATSRLKWLALQPPGYRPQPYRQLAKVLGETGREEGATDVRIAKEVALRRHGNLTLLQRAWNLMLEATIGFGYRPLRALWWIAGFVVLGTILFRWGYDMRLITPTEEAAYREFVASGEAPPHYPIFNPFVYSLENFLPVVELHQDKYWRPNPRHGVRGRVTLAGNPRDSSSLPSRFLRWYLWIHILAGWTITPLLFAGLSGLVRPD
jgi:hypothetical protein